MSYGKNRIQLYLYYRDEEMKNEKRIHKLTGRHIMKNMKREREGKNNQTEGTVKLDKKKN